MNLNEDDARQVYERARSTLVNIDWDRDSTPAQRAEARNALAELDRRFLNHIEATLDARTTQLRQFSAFLQNVTRVLANGGGALKPIEDLRALVEEVNALLEPPNENPGGDGHDAGKPDS